MLAQAQTNAFKITRSTLKNHAQKEGEADAILTHTSHTHALKHSSTQGCASVYALNKLHLLVLRIPLSASNVLLAMIFTTIHTRSTHTRTLTRTHARKHVRMYVSCLIMLRLPAAHL